MMQKPLMYALAAALGLTLWVATQDDGATVEPVRQQGSASPKGQRSPASASDTTERGDTSGRPGSGKRSSARDEGPSPAEREALIAGVARWQARTAATGLSWVSPQAWASVQPPPPPPAKLVAPPPPPPPMAPPFTYKWLGRINDEQATLPKTPAPTAAQQGSSASAPAPTLAGAASPPAVPRPMQAVQRAVIAGPRSTWVVREGDVIEGQWRVDSIQDRSMSLTYLPLQQAQTIAMSSP